MVVQKVVGYESIIHHFNDRIGILGSSCIWHENRLVQQLVLQV